MWSERGALAARRSLLNKAGQDVSERLCRETASISAFCSRALA
jgi:hypothetical protein